MSRIKAEREVRKQNDSGLTGSVGNTSQHIFSRRKLHIYSELSTQVARVLAYINVF